MAACVWCDVAHLSQHAFKKYHGEVMYQNSINVKLLDTSVLCRSWLRQLHCHIRDIMLLLNVNFTKSLIGGSRAHLVQHALYKHNNVGVLLPTATTRCTKRLWNKCVLCQLRNRLFYLHIFWLFFYFYVAGFTILSSTAQHITKAGKHTAVDLFQ